MWTDSEGVAHYTPQNDREKDAAENPGGTVTEQGAYLRSVVLGHTRYFSVPTNSRSINNFRKEVCRL